MKRMVLGFFGAALILSSCGKNNCYSCKLVIRDDAGIVALYDMPKRCRVKQSEIDKMIQDSTKSWEGVNYSRGGVKVTYKQTVECSKDNYW